MSVEFGNGASAGTLGKVQLESGTVATEFEFRPYETELGYCQRYWRELYQHPQVIIPLNVCVRYGTPSIFGGAHWPLMRTTPTVTNTSPSWSADANPATANEIGAYNLTADAAVTITGTPTLAVDNLFPEGGRLNITASTSFSGTTGDIVDFRLGQAAHIYLDAEL